jgi:peptide deformylase
MPSPTLTSTARVRPGAYASKLIPCASEPETRTAIGTLDGVSTFSIRTLGDPVLTQRAREVEELNGELAHLVDEMYDAMYEAIGVGLAAPQVGVRKRLFTFDLGEGPQVVVNPELVEASGEAGFEEGCLSIPGLRFEVIRPEKITMAGLDLDGHEVVFEDDDFLARVIQHELDHLDGVLMLDRLEPDARREAMRMLRDLDMTAIEEPAGPRL